VCLVTGPFDYIHYHVPRTGLDDIAKSVGIQPVGTFRCVLAETILSSPIYKLMLPMLESGSQLPALIARPPPVCFWCPPLAEVCGTTKASGNDTRRLAPWQKRKAAEFLTNQFGQ